jgi:hypothetical protein
MFERLKRRAEGEATKLAASRRGFLGRVGRGALVTAGALGALLAAPGPARAGHHINFKKCMASCCGTDGFCDTADGYSECYFLCTMAQ